ncbi:MBL fold metallo-hydrolase [Corynebacterium epidermidicanis]|uniref:MBL fold metallo-hydrolase n=1 Tax=Corynebacterium epidermidicanis TaxID=1050174 RepID=UPI001F362AD9|nr:MBL fold metallo-hydrolase [Corynebacterium epidermidicanis]
MSERFARQPEVLRDEDGSGVEVATRVFEHSETLVVSDPTPGAQLRAASIAVAAHAPMVVSHSANNSAIQEAVSRLKVNTVLLVGDPALQDFGATKVVRDPGTEQGLTQLTASKFNSVETTEPVKSLAQLQANQPVLLRHPDWNLPERGDTPADNFPFQSVQDGGSAPVVVVTEESSLASVASAKAFGAQVRYLSYPDPRVDDKAMEAVAGLSEAPLLALGRQFGDSATLQRRIQMGEKITQQQPGGGGLVFPGRRIVALYGHPSGPALGAMGEQPPAEAVARVKDLAAQYQHHSAEPVVPAFEVIATVASGGPGADGDFSNESDPQELVPYIDAITQAGGYAILDLQPGRASLLQQAQRYEELLKRPNVGLALDPEWKIGPSERPMQRVGSAEAAEINEVSDWLATLTRENKLPQKAFVLHQFQLQMIRDREQLNLSHDELAFVLHIDGHGSTGDKFATWDTMREGLDPRFFLAWKNFIDEDKPMFNPERTMNEVRPRPWLVTYQ